ncbi:unnamed protein product [Arctogadus glacialis]
MYLFMPLKIYFLTPLRFAVLLVYAHCLTPFNVARAPVLICCFPVKSHARQWIIYIDTARAGGIFVLIHNVEATQVRVRCGTARTLVSVHGYVQVIACASRPPCSNLYRRTKKIQDGTMIVRQDQRILDEGNNLDHFSKRTAKLLNKNKPNSDLVLDMRGTLKLLWKN